MPYLYNTCKLLLAIVLLTPVAASAQSADQTFAQIESAMKASDAATLSNFFHSTVEVTVMDKDEAYPKNQAQGVLREFFTNYPLRTFTIMHKGSSGNTWYAVGAYVSPRGTFDVNILLKKHGEKYLVETLRLERNQ